MTENPTATAPKMTHEQFILAVRDIVSARLDAQTDRDRLLNAKLVYGVGAGYYRGICHWNSWQNGHPESESLIEIAATGEESPLQLAGTTIHECGHALTPYAGHDAHWKAACRKLGLTTVTAAGQIYDPSHFAPDVAAKIAALPVPDDGAPVFNGAARGAVGPLVGGLTAKLRPCRIGQGTRGGTSRGAGSGRMVGVKCPRCDYKVRITRRWLADAAYGAPKCPAHLDIMVEY